MPYLTKPQMTLIRQVAAEVARNTLNESLNTGAPKIEKARGEAIGFFGSGILDDISRIAAATARKALGQIVAENQRMAEDARRIATADEAHDKTVADCKARFTNPIPPFPGFPTMVHHASELFGRYLRPIYPSQAGEQDICLNIKGKPTKYFRCVSKFEDIKDGDIYFTTLGEHMTFFMGEWRRRSALESFADAKKYL